jgi:hypothetical protein
MTGAPAARQGSSPAAIAAQWKETTAMSDTKSDDDYDFGPRTQEIQRALARVIDYLEYDERKNYEENPVKGHIYESVKVLRETLAK